MIITSASNERIKAAMALRSRRHRAARSQILVEGETEIRRALAAGVQPDTLFTAAGAGSEIRELVATAGGDVVEVAGDALDRLAVRGGDTPVLVAARPTVDFADLAPMPSRPLVLVIESMEKPGNVGAMLRTADGVGVDAVILADALADVFSPNVIRASIGAVFAVPIAVTETPAAIRWLRDHEILIVATSPEATSLWNEPDLTRSVACVIGAEHAGLSENWLAAADVSVALPMLGIGDSLNASTTAAILLYEARRQRQSANGHPPEGR